MSSIWDEEFDLIAVGSGCGGLTAAIAAAQRGVRALVVEKDSRAGGVTALSGGQIWVGPNSLQADLGIEDSREETLAYVDYLSGGAGDVSARRTFVERGDEALAALAQSGLRLAVIRGHPDYYYPDAPGSRSEGRYLEVVPFDASLLGTWADRVVSSAGWSIPAHTGSHASFADIFSTAGDPAALSRRIAERAARGERSQGSGLAANLVHVALELGVELWTSCPAVGIVGASRAEGLIVSRSGQEMRIRATSGVVLATSGYDWSPTLVREYESIDDLYSLTSPTVTGDHFSLAAGLRAAVSTTLQQNTYRNVGIHIPGETWGGRDLVRIVYAGYPGSMLVNYGGRRFGDEAFYRSYVSSLSNFDADHQRPANWPAWLIFDQHYLDTYGIGSIAPGQRPPADLAHAGDSVEELASAAGIEPSGLRETFTRMSRFAETGVDEDFGRGSRPLSNLLYGDPRVAPNPNLRAIDYAPFYAVPLRRVGTGISTAGLKTDAAARVVDIDGRVIPGLFAVGNAAARLEFGHGYNSGMANARGIVFGYLAALAATESHS